MFVFDANCKRISFLCEDVVKVMFSESENLLENALFQNGALQVKHLLGAQEKR